jgi:hypothetical protein
MMGPDCPYEPENTRTKKYRLDHGIGISNPTVVLSDCS